MPAAQRESVQEGLGLLCVAREALPLAVLALALSSAEPDERLLVLSHHPFRGGWLADQKDADGWVRSRA